MKKSTLKKIIENQKSEIEQLQNKIKSYGNPCNSCSKSFDYANLEDSSKRCVPGIDCTSKYKLICENSDNERRI